MNEQALPQVTEPARPRGNYPAGVMKRPNRFFIDPRAIRVEPGHNKRFDFGDIEGMANSIQAELKRDPAGGGLLNDIRVVRYAKPTADGGIFGLTDGERRFRGVQLLLERGVEFPDGIPAKIDHHSTPALDRLILMFTANTGKPFLPLEQAAAFKAMRAAGMSLKQIEQTTGCSDNSIVGALALLDAPDELREAVKDGSIGGGLAKSIAVNARGDAAKQKELTAAAKAAGKDKSKKKAVLKAVDDARRAKAAKKGLKLKMRALTDEQLKQLGERMSEEVAKIMTACELPHDSDLMSWLKESDDPEMVLAYSFGALQGLKAAAGLAVPLVLPAAESAA